MESNDKPANVLIEPQNRRRLKELAERHKRSMNGEANWIIERAYENEQVSTDPSPQPTATN